MRIHSFLVSSFQYTLHLFVLGIVFLYGFLHIPSTLASPPNVGGCDIFPADNPWNQSIINVPVHPLSDNWVDSIGRTDTMHPDFGSGLWNGNPIGIPYITVDDTQPDVPVNFIWYPNESDPGPYPIPLDAPIEGGSDKHVIAIDTSDCTLYEMFASTPQATYWEAGNGAVFDLNSNNLRPDGWTSADAAGLPIFAGLARYDEVLSGQINHALRFTVNYSQAAYLYPARHYASNAANPNDPNLPPMGARFRIKASWYNANASNFTGQSRVILDALRNYGMILADNGSDWFLSGAPDEGWDNSNLNQLKTIPGDAFEAVDTSGIIPNPPPANWNLLYNGNFSNGEVGWKFKGSSTSAHSWSNGVETVGLNSASIGFMQQYRGKFAVPPGLPININVQFGNNDNVSQQVAIQMHNSDKSEFLQCVFTIPANTSLKTHRMRFTTVTYWNVIVVRVRPMTSGTAGILVDNIDVQYKPTWNVPNKTCVAPVANDEPVTTELAVMENDENITCTLINWQSTDEWDSAYRSTSLVQFVFDPFPETLLNNDIYDGNGDGYADTLSDVLQYDAISAVHSLLREATIAMVSDRLDSSHPSDWWQVEIDVVEALSSQNPQLIQALADDFALQNRMCQ